MATPLELKIDKANDLQKLARDLKAAGNVELRKELLRGIQQATKPIKQSIKPAALRELPKRGGLNQVIAGSKVGVRTRTGKNPAVVVVTKHVKHDVRALDRGILRHPVFGRDEWVTQRIPPDWWTNEMRRQEPQAARDVIAVLDSVAKKAGF